MKLSIVLIAHGAYATMLPEAIGSIDGQSVPFDEKVLVCDKFDPPNLRDWKTIRVDAGNPNPARNAGLDATTGEWVVFFDADNLMHSDYAAVCRRRAERAPESVAFLYPTIRYFGKADRLVCPPDFSADDVSLRNAYDTSSCWRVSALRDERWDEESLCHDDWGLVLRLIRQGWRGDRLMTHVDMREHDVGVRRSVAGWRNDDDRRAKMLWKIRSMGVASLISRPEMFDRWCRQLETLDLPPVRSLYVLDNTNDDAFHAELVDRLSRMKGWESITLVRDEVGSDEVREIDELHQDRLRNIARLTNKLWKCVKEDILLSIDDDVFAESPDAVRKLHYHLRPQGAAVAGAAYRSKKVSDCLVATYGKESYGSPITAKHDKVSDVAAVGAGFTLYLRPALTRECFPIRKFKKSTEAGHDYHVCYLLRRAGYRIILDGEVRADHA